MIADTVRDSVVESCIAWHDLHMAPEGHIQPTAQELADVAGVTVDQLRSEISRWWQFDLSEARGWREVGVQRWTHYIKDGVCWAVTVKKPATSEKYYVNVKHSYYVRGTQLG